MTDKIYPRKESLEAVHTFPCKFTIKVIGANTPTFIEAARSTVEAVTQDSSRLTLTTRESSKGKHVSVNLEVHVETPEQVQDLYARLKKLDALQYIF